VPINQGKTKMPTELEINAALKAFRSVMGTNSLYLCVKAALQAAEHVRKTGEWPNLRSTKLANRLTMGED
jgi:hypothetical protein